MSCKNFLCNIIWYSLLNTNYLKLRIWRAIKTNSSIVPAVLMDLRVTRWRTRQFPAQTSALKRLPPLLFQYPQRWRWSDVSPRSSWNPLLWSRAVSSQLQFTASKQVRYSLEISSKYAVMWSRTVINSVNSIVFDLVAMELIGRVISCSGVIDTSRWIAVIFICLCCKLTKIEQSTTK